MNSQRIRQVLATALVSSSLAAGSAGVVAAGEADQPAQTLTAGKWVPRKLRFTYSGFTAHYSCDGLRDQVTSILRQLGAGNDLVVKSRGCTRLEGPEPFPGVDATFSALEPSGGSAAPGTVSQSVPARWDEVTLNSDTTRNYTNEGGCELIEQVKKYILPLFATRNLKFSSDCFPHTVSLSGARLSMEVLMPVKPAQPQPATP